MAAYSVGEVGRHCIIQAASPLKSLDLLDVVSRPEGVTVRAAVAVEPADSYLSGHFPNLTVYPGIFLIEALTHTVKFALKSSESAQLHLVEIRSVRFVAPLLSGDVASLEVKIFFGDESHFEARAVCTRRDGVIAARLKIAYRYDA